MLLERFDLPVDHREGHFAYDDPIFDVIVELRNRGLVYYVTGVPVDDGTEAEDNHLTPMGKLMLQTIHAFSV